MFEWFHLIYQRLTRDASIKTQTVQSGIWLAAINISNRVLQLLKIIILARLLSPKAFGLLGIALLAMVALRQFSTLGVDEALIQHEEDNIDIYLNTAWVMKTIRGALIAIIAFLTAPYLAALFGEPQAKPLIQVLGITTLITGIQNPAVIYFRKNLNFHKEFAYQVGGRIFDFIVAVVLAIEFRNVWALVGGIITMNLAKLILSYIIHEYRPSFEFDWGYGKEMFEFGKWMFALAILSFIYKQGDDIFVGWFFAATALGYYQIGYRYSNAPATEIAQVFNRVTFPAFSKVQNDLDKFRNGFLQAIRLSMAISLPISAGIIAVAPSFVNVIFGEQWSPMTPLIQVLAIWGAIRSFSNVSSSVFKAAGKPEYDTYFTFFRVVFIVFMIYPAAQYFGIVGVAYIIVGQAVIIEPVRTYYVASIVDLKKFRLLRPVIFPAIGSSILFVNIGILNYYWFHSHNLIELVSFISIGIISYIVSMTIIDFTTNYEFINIFKQIRADIF